MDPLDRVRNLLQPGESLLWTGRPDPAVVFTGADFFLIPFSVMWAGFTVFWEAGVIASGGPPFFVLWGIPFLLVGGYITVGRFVYKSRRKRSTVYAVTSRRALTSAGENSYSELPLSGAPLQVRRSRDGQHVSVIFGASTWPGTSAYLNTGMDLMMFGRAAAFAFFDVEGPDELLRAIDRARSTSPT